MNHNSPESEPKPEQEHLPSRDVEVKPRRGWKRRHSWLAAALLLAVGLLGAGLNRLTPVKPGRPENFSSRVERYLGHGQARADFRTFGAALRYLLQNDGALPSTTGGTNLPVAANPTSDSPRS